MRGKREPRTTRERGVPMINKREGRQGGRGQLTMNNMVTTKERN